MKKIFMLLPVALLGAGLQHSDAQDSSYFSMSAQIRPRAEFRDGAFRPLLPQEDPAMHISSRHRLNFDFHHKDLLDLRVSLQNVSVWGQANAVQPVEKGGNTLALFEAYGDVKIAGALRTRFGRQAISLDDERFFGVVDWAQGARSHDALAFLYKKNGWEGRLYVAYNQNYKANYDNNINNPAGNRYATADAQAYKTMQTFYGKAPAGKYGYVSLIAANTGLQNALSDTVNNTLYQQQTLGLNYFRNAPQWSLALSGFYQMGKNIAGLTTEAYLLAFKAGVPFAHQWDAAIGADYLSGNDFGAPNDKFRAFVVPYATNHKFYGHMDYFNAGNPHGGVGLFDKYLSLGYKASATTKINLIAHWFHATGDIYVANVKQDADLGQELDLNFSWKAYPFLDMTGGYSAYHTTGSLNRVKGTIGAADWQHWVWLSANLNLEVLRVKR